MNVINLWCRLGIGIVKSTTLKLKFNDHAQETRYEHYHYHQSKTIQSKRTKHKTVQKKKTQANLSS